VTDQRRCGRQISAENGDCGVRRVRVQGGALREDSSPACLEKIGGGRGGPVAGAPPLLWTAGGQTPPRGVARSVRA
jgi:hypothetical protein